MFHTVIFRQNASNHINFVNFSYGNENIRAVNIRVIQSYRICAAFINRHNVKIFLDGYKLVFIFIDNDNFNLFVAQKFGDCITELARSYNYYAHFLLISLRIIAAVVSVRRGQRVAVFVFRRLGRILSAVVSVRWSGAIVVSVIVAAVISVRRG